MKNDIPIPVDPGHSLDLGRYIQLVDRVHLSRESGKVTELKGMLIKGTLPGASVGSLVKIQINSEKSVLAEVVGFQDKSVLLMALSEYHGLSMGARIVMAKSHAEVKVSDELLGRVVNGLGEPLDGLGIVENSVDVRLYKAVRNPLEREPIAETLDLGVRAINGLITIGRGQRISIMAGSGVGKSVLLGMIARNTEADVNVIALIGERGREVNEFISRDLGPEGLKKSVVVCVTGDQSPILRMRGAFVATAIAEHFCGQGKKVLLMMDSVTRFAMAQREVGLSVGEPPSSRGYTPSVFSTLPKLLERPGNFQGEGSITAIYTTLVEGDDMNDPVGDSVRSIVDGHIVLSRDLAHKNHFPAIDVLQSTSRVMRSIVDDEKMDAANKLREILAIYKEAEDLINIGAYKSGANPKIDRAIRLIAHVNAFLKQKVEDPTSLVDTFNELINIARA